MDQSHCCHPHPAATKISLGEIKSRILPPSPGGREGAADLIKEPEGETKRAPQASSRLSRQSPFDPAQEPTKIPATDQRGGNAAMSQGKLISAVCAGLLIFSASGQAQEAGDTLALETIQAADYMKGKRSFQGRCSACHTLADDSGDIAGPNLWGVFDRVAGAKEGFTFSDTLQAADFTWTPGRLDAWLADPEGYLPDNIMGIPEAVPEEERLNILHFMMIETGAVDWERPETNFADVQEDRSKPASERFPSFWNHLMYNTSRYRWEDEEAGEEFRFDAYFKQDGSVASNYEGLTGFWHITERDFFCYALKGLPVSVGTMVECFPVAAMAIPRFAEELWTSNPHGKVKLHGGMVPGRPDWVGGELAETQGQDAHPGYWENLYANTMRYEITVAEGQVEEIDLYFDEGGRVASKSGRVSGKWLVKGEEGGEQEMCYEISGVSGAAAVLRECFKLELMFNPRIGARWPSKFEDGTAYWAEVVEGRG